MSPDSSELAGRRIFGSKYNAYSADIIVQHRVFIDIDDRFRLRENAKLRYAVDGAIKSVTDFFAQTRGANKGKTSEFEKCVTKHTTKDWDPRKTGFSLSSAANNVMSSMN
jgi:hypothetical protein